MKKHLCIVATAAALTVGGLSYTSFAEDANGNKTVTEKAGDAIKNAEVKTGLRSADQASQEQTKSAEEIHDVMAQVAEAALTKDGMNDVVERFVDADRNRLGQNKDQFKNDDTMNGRIAELQKDWKAKYGTEFDIKDEDKVYNLQFAQISEGEQGARTAGEKISGDANTAGPGASASGNVGGDHGVSASGNVNTDTGTANVNVDNKTGVDKPSVNSSGQTAADTNRNDPGRNIATVHIAESHGLPALDVPFIHEAGGWKIDIPDSVDAAKLKANVQTALTELGDKKDQWASTDDEAYRHFSHRLLLAIFDKQATSGATGAAQ
jgi:hypothetical protein